LEEVAVSLKIRVAVAVVALLTCLSFATTDAVSAKRFFRASGTISHGKNYIVIVTTKNGGGARQKLKKNGKFSIKLPASKAVGATLTIVKPNGRYFGPVVLRHSGRKAYTRLSGESVALGTLKLHAGYATTGSAIGKNAVSSSAVAANRKGKPAGAGKLGLIKRPATHKSRTTRAHAHALADPATAPQGADTDADGLPNNFDIDDDGDLLLDPSDPDSGSGNNDPVKVFTNLRVGLRDTINVNALPADTDIVPLENTLIQNNLAMVFTMNEGNAGLSGLSAVNIDCGLLVYCAHGAGTATTVQSGPTGDPNGPADGSLWTSFDPDSDGYPNLPDASKRFNDGKTWFDLSTHPATKRSNVNAGDTFTFLGTASGGVSAFATALPPYFVTTPAIHTIVDTGSTHTVSYPVQSSDPGVGGSTGTNEPPPPNPNMALTSDIVTVSLWRPQRNAVPGAESGSVIDMGKLGYFFTAGNATCTKDDIKSVSAGTSVANEGMFDYVKDSAADATPNAANLITVTIDVGQCFARSTNNGLSSRTNGFSFGVEARTVRGDSAGTSLWVTLP
jgi:hypothetical protein